MGSDIYTESAVAVRFDDFLNRKELDENHIRNGIVNDLIGNDIVIEGLTQKLMMRDSKTALIGKLVDLISMSEGYEDDRERNTQILKIFCENVGIDLDSLPECNFRSFESS